VFFDEWLQVSGGRDQFTNLYSALIHLSNGDSENAKNLLKEQIEADATDELTQKAYSPFARDLLTKLKGEKPSGSNARFELKGYQEAEFVCLFLTDESPVLNFLLKSSEGWYGDFALPPGKTPYAFIIDGETVLDPSNPESEIVDVEEGKIELNIRVVN
jgi:hypothetical protein